MAKCLKGNEKIVRLNQGFKLNEFELPRVNYIV